jgi:2-polyprenyl-3-methyl-5-hydroxy-6-metoxy-1,4-benzoquinol methylase
MAMALATRSTADERMDTGCVDYADYQRCLRDLGRVNTVTLTHRPMLAWLGRMTQGLSGFSLLDVACGHGDALRRIQAWSARRNLAARLEGIDLNPWSTRAATEATPAAAAIRFITGDVFAFEPQTRYDFIISSQFTHHLTDTQIVAFIHWMEAHANRGWFIGDLHRHWFPYYGFELLARIARWHRFVRYDGRVSIARSFTLADWQRILSTAGLNNCAATVRWHLPFRICVERPCDRP